MSLPIVLCALGLSLFAAARSCWSPCGLSMLSSITPLGEKGKGHSFRLTAAAYIVGGVLGGATLGAVLVGLSALFNLIGLPTTTRVVVAAAIALLGAGTDLGLLGIKLPLLRRQVNELWLDRYRGWIYGLGFGWQIGTGFTTYLMTASVVGVSLMAVLSGSKTMALVIGLTFGTARGLSALAASTITSPQKLVEVHRRFAALRRPVWVVTASAQVAVAAVLASVLWTPAALIVLGVGGMGLIWLGPTRLARLAGEPSS